MTITRNPSKLPQRIPVFPLCGVVLMPFGHVPLNVFEPRYLNMVDDVLGGARLIALVQPRDIFPDLVPDDAALYSVGTVGRIVSFHDPGNGTYQITLEGLSRFRVAGDNAIDPARGYRTIEADFTAYQTDLRPDEENDGPERGRILELLRDYFSSKGIEADWSSVSDAPYEALVSSLVMTCPFEPGERQALLECENHAQRAQMLISLFEMNVEGPIAPGGLKH